MSKRKGLPPIAPAGGAGFPEMAPGRDDMAMGFVAFLGRETSKPSDLDVAPGTSWRDMIVRFIGSPEFSNQILPHLVQGTVPRHGNTVASEQLPALATWLARIVRGPGCPGADDLAAAPSWPAMLAAWLGNRMMIPLICPTPGTTDREVTAAWALDELVKKV
ncbi:MAG: hypothetical protein PHS60_10350 [Zavarzinia sp.]|nr:hypothetical protein [Zavarzinia sp.]